MQYRSVDYQTDHCSSEHGGVLVFVALTVLVLLMFVGLALDIGNVFFRKRIVQASVDAAAMGAADSFKAAPNGSQTSSEASLLAARNGLVGAPTTSCGTWNVNTRIFTAGSCSTLVANGRGAVRATSAESVSTRFGKFVGVDFLSAKAISTVQISFADGCISPFGLAVSDVNGKSVGQQFTTGEVSTGDWGRLKNIPGYDPQNFVNAMLNGTACGVPITVPCAAGTCDASSDPGFSQLNSNMTNLQGHSMILAVISGSQGSHPVAINRYIRATYNYCSPPCNGGHWTGVFTLDADPVTPPVSPSSLQRQRVE